MTRRIDFRPTRASTRGAQAQQGWGTWKGTDGTTGREGHYPIKTALQIQLPHHTLTQSLQCRLVKTEAGRESSALVQWNLHL